MSCGGANAEDRLNTHIHMSRNPFAPSPSRNFNMRPVRSSSSKAYASFAHIFIRLVVEYTKANHMSLALIRDVAATAASL